MEFDIIFNVQDDLRKKLGQLFFVGIKGNKLTSRTKYFLNKVQPGGIIFFETNISNKKQLKKLIHDISKLLAIKPFIACDQEGGSVERLRKICTSTPSMCGLSKLGLKELLKAQKIIVNELSELGFNTNLAPVLDINSNPKNPIIGTRAISNNRLTVAKYGKEIINLYLKNHIIPVAKHFPGHGNLSTDSHLTLPTLRKSLGELSHFEFHPFKHAIKAKVPVIMVGHIYLPKIEKTTKRPSSLSKKVINNILRKKLNFKGLVITDELNMKGVTKHFSLSEAAAIALESGANLLLFNSDEEKTLKVFNYLIKKVKNNKTILNNLNKSYGKIIQTKIKFLKARKTQHKTPKNHFNTSYQLTNKIVRWLKKDPNLLFPLNNDSTSVIYPKTPKLKVDTLIKILKKTGFKKYRLHNYRLSPKEAEVKRIAKETLKSKNIILITYDVPAFSSQKNLANKLLTLNKNLIVIGAGTEYDINVVPKFKNYILASAPNYISLLCAFQKLKKG